MDPTPNEGPPLEDRLRGLILNHPAPVPVIPSTQPQPPRDALPGLPENMSSYGGAGAGRGYPPILQQPPGLGQAHPNLNLQGPPSLGNDTADVMSKSRNRRPNQAQRRQMSAQLSIPIEPQHQAPPTPQSARSYASPQGFAPQQAQQYAGGSHYRNQRPHSATFRPPSRDNANNALPHGHGGREKETPCRNILMYGRCRYQDQGCTFKHDLDRSVPAVTGVSFPSHPRHQASLSYNGPSSTGNQDWRQQGQGHNHGQPQGEFHAQRTLFDPLSPRNSRHGHTHSGQYPAQPEDMKAQADLLESLCNTIIAGAEIKPADIAEKENFRIRIEEAARSVISQHEREQNGLLDFPPSSVELKCFGSLSSGFATKAADMDLGLLSPLSLVRPDAPNSPIPRLVEKAFLDIGLAARLLTRTRVPIIKVCEKPPAQLRKDLLEERAKWERGTEGEVVNEVAHDEPEPSPTEDLQQDEYKRLGFANRGHQNQMKSRDEKKFPSLNQGQKSLQSYFSHAKALLRRLGGRDLSSGIAREFGPDEYRFINDFSREFIDGLSDSELRERLLSYRSFRRQDIPNFRTLYGVHAQAEGEKLIMLWESRQIRERDDYQERQAQKLVTTWKELQDKPGYGRDPLNYNKELSLVADQLRKIPSIQLMQHSQNQHEPASVYHQRTSRLMAELGGFDTPSAKNYVLPAVIRQFVQGIYSEDIRRQMSEFVDSHPLMSLRSVARKHKCLQLAHDYEKCLGQGLYPEDSVPLIQAYIKALRKPMVLALKPGRNMDNIIVPCTESLASKGSEILRLGDPSKMSPNQPRDPYRDRLEFPKSGVGVQCDINFSAQLALQNTLLLRCYSHCDPRVRPLVLFVKHWAKVRGINSPYRGTLSSYGYVLMMLHYLVNVAQPFVCPNLQLLAPPPNPNLSPKQVEETSTCQGRDIRFWRDEAAIQALARENALNQNHDSIGALLRGFFEYYAHPNFISSGQCRGFDWGRDVLSIRTHGGLLSKQEKGWTGAKTVIEVASPSVPTPTAAIPGSSTEPVQDDAGAGQQDQVISPGMNSFNTGESGALREVPPSESSNPSSAALTTPTSAQPAREFKEVRYRYLFAIEDPFELEHNVARTVTHNGIVAIRDEFRRAWRIIKNAGKDSGPHEDILEDVTTADEMRERDEFQKLLVELHGEMWAEGFLGMGTKEASLNSVDSKEGDQ